MKEKITGNDYSYIVELNNEGKDYCFQILCLHKNSKKKSSITNVNFILSEIVSVVDDEKKAEDSWIDVSPQKGEKIFSIAMKNFKNNLWVRHLEKNLDEDRSCGGWNSNFKI